MTTEQNLKLKLTFGYIILITIFSLSILYILREVKNLNVSKDDIVFENTKVIQLGNIMSDLYATENSGRMALLSYNKKDAIAYHNQLDSLIFKIETLKNNNIKSNTVKLKLDTIVDIIKLKSLTFDQVLDVQAKYTNFDIYTEAKTQIQAMHNVVDTQTVKIDTALQKTSWWGRVKKRFQDSDEALKQKLVEENKKIIQQQLENQKQEQERISKATDNILSKAKNTEVKLLRNYYKKEEQLIERNKELSFKLRNILSDVEKIILQNSSHQYQVSKRVIDNVSNNIAKIGIIISVVALFFGVVILRDLNKSARNKQKLEKLNNEMEELMKQKSFFMATISHDMVSPINSLIGFSSLLGNSLKLPKQQEYLKNIVQSTKYIKKMVDDLSLFSNLEYNKIKIKYANFNFYDLMQNVQNILAPSANKKNIDLVFSIDDKLNTQFTSDAFRIQQILTNVISNAIKFTHKGSVTVEAKLENRKAKITIIDTGIGIKIDNKEDLFIEFVQAHDTNENNYGGSGLGLNITKRLVSLLKGTITYESEFNKGTVFYITIPLKQFEESKEIQKIDAYEYDNAKKLENKNILVIDDDQLQLKLIQEIFGNKVKKLKTLDNGKHAKKELQEEHYHLIITDMQMPFYSGVKVIEDIRSLEQYKNTPVIALTGKIDFDESEYKKLGFNIYLQKPLNIDTLYNTIYKTLRIKIKEPQVSPLPKTPMQLKHNNFDLTDLFTLLENDKEACKEILNSFYTSAEVDIKNLQNALTLNNINDVQQIAHKMLPMFRQLNITEVVEKLSLLEKNANSMIKEDILKAIDVINTKTHLILQEIKKAVE